MIFINGAKDGIENSCGDYANADRIDDRGGITAASGFWIFWEIFFEESCKLKLSSGTGGTCDFGAIGIKLRSDRTW